MFASPLGASRQTITRPEIAPFPVGGGDLAENPPESGKPPTSSYQQIHAHKPLFGNQGKVLNLDHLDFDIVSNPHFHGDEFTPVKAGVLRISYFSYRDTLHASRFTKLPSTSVENALQIGSFMQNKANFLDALMNVTSLITIDYENIANCKLGENKPKQSQFTFYRRERCVRREEGYLCK